MYSHQRNSEKNKEFLNITSTKLNATLYTVSNTVKVAKNIGLIRVDKNPIKYDDLNNYVDSDAYSCVKSYFITTQRNPF